MHTVAGDGVIGIKRRRRDLSSDGIGTTSGRGRLKEDLKSSTLRWRQDYKATPSRRYLYKYKAIFKVTLISKLDVSNPLHLHPNDFAALTVIYVKLKGTENYQVWSYAMLLALEGKNKTGFIDGSCKRSNNDEFKWKSQLHSALGASGLIINSRANQHLTYIGIDLVNVIAISNLGITVLHPNGTEACISKVGNMVLNENLTLYDVFVVPEYYEPCVCS
uniref:Ribonuclease H-like domain-containing protein n=1 Tax=Tanacetum cinerariifolium TaxID=118510 RepID=A0A6L2N8V6_TANCI|nr:ribonuclease H-like domain-containing protein [Tanacetum cinerariifolium]